MKFSVAYAGEPEGLKLGTARGSIREPLATDAAKGLLQRARPERTVSPPAIISFEDFCTPRHLPVDWAACAVI